MLIVFLGCVRLSALSKSSINPYILAMGYNFFKHAKPKNEIKTFWKKNFDLYILPSPSQIIVLEKKYNL